MKLLGTPVLFLMAAGCLWVSVTQGLVPTINQLISEKCIRNAGPQGREIYRGVAMYFGVYCIDSGNGGRTSQFNESNTLVQMYCPNLTNIKTCFKRTTNLFRPCLELDEQESVDVIYNMTSSYLDFICHHEELFNVLSFNSEGCFSSSRQAVQNCADQMISTYMPNVSSVEDPTAGLRTRLAKPLILNAGDCLGLKQFQHCIVNALNVCENKTTALMVESMMNHVVNATPCTRLLKAQTSPTTELNLSPVEQLESIIRTGCEKNGDSTMSKTAIDGLRSFSNCFTTLVNTTQFEAEVIDAAASPSELDTLFENYSRKVPILTGCIEQVVDFIQPCLALEYRETIDVVRSITNSWLLNIFHSQGDSNATRVD